MIIEKYGMFWGIGTIAARSATEEFSLWNRGNCWKAWNNRVIGTIVVRSAAENSDCGTVKNVGKHGMFGKLGQSRREALREFCDFGTVKQLKSIGYLGNWNNRGATRRGNELTLIQKNHLEKE